MPASLYFDKLFTARGERCGQSRTYLHNVHGRVLNTGRSWSQPTTIRMQKNPYPTKLFQHDMTANCYVVAIYCAGQMRCSRSHAPHITLHSCGRRTIGAVETHARQVVSCIHAVGPCRTSHSQAQAHRDERELEVFVLQRRRTEHSSIPVGKRPVLPVTYCSITRRCPGNAQLHVIFPRESRLLQPRFDAGRQHVRQIVHRSLPGVMLTVARRSTGASQPKRFTFTSLQASSL